MSGNINYENINDVINSIYDFETSNPNMYRIEYIPRHEINMWQYKKHENFDYKHIKECAQIQIYECFYENCYLDELLDKGINEEQCKALIFQILFVLSKINEKLPFFKHNRLNTDSFFVYLKKNTEKTKEYYLG